MYKWQFLTIGIIAYICISLDPLLLEEKLILYSETKIDGLNLKSRIYIC